MFVPQVAIQRDTVFDRTMIGKRVSDKTEVGFYTQGENLIKLLLTIITSLGVVMLPRIASSFVEKNYDQIRYYIYKAFNLVFLLSFPMIAGIAMVADIFVPKFFGPGFDGVAKIMIVISPILVLIGMSNVIGVQYLLPTKHQKEYTLSVVFGAIVNFLANLILIYKFKAVGAAIGTVIAESVVTITQMIFVRKELKILHILRIAINYVLPTGIMAVCCFLLRRQLDSSVKSIILIAGFGVFVYGICLLFFKNQFVMETLNSLIKKIKKILKK
jgi:O-antigen/teichoic acid export membrane protein